MSKTKIILSVLILLVISAVAASYLYHKFHKAPKATASKTKIVTTRTLQLQTIAQSVFTYGQVVAPNSVQIKAQVNGIITKLDFKAGAVVHQGQVIYTLRSSDTATQVQTLNAQMQSSRQIYQRSLRASRLTPGAIAKSSLQTERLQYQQDLAAYQQAKAIHNTVAPITGVITDTDYAVGDFISSGAVLATIVANKKLQLKYELPNQYANQVKVGQQVWFTAKSSHQTYSALVSYVAPELNEANQALLLRAEFTQPVAMLANDFGAIRQVLNPDFKTLAIKQELMQTDAQGFYVYLVVKNKITKHYFQPGEITKQGLVVVKSGLDDKDVLITTDPKMLTPEQVVKVKVL